MEASPPGEMPAKTEGKLAKLVVSLVNPKLRLFSRPGTLATLVG